MKGNKPIYGTVFGAKQGDKWNQFLPINDAELSSGILLSCLCCPIKIV